MKSPSLPYSERFPIILPYASDFSHLLVEYIHLLLVYGGNQLILRIVRIEYWVLWIKTLNRSVIRKCKTCILGRKLRSTDHDCVAP